jgi:AcrR family transcriptional regulator
MSPRRRFPVSSAQDVRTHLLDAALRAFAHRGFSGASIRDIAKEAKVASGLLYHYFPSKDAILEALFERSGRYVLQAFGEVVAIADPRDKLAALVRASARLVREHEEFWRVSYGVRFQNAVIAGLAEGIAAQSALYVQLFSSLLEEIGRKEPGLDARLLFATLDGVFQHYVLAPSSYPLDPVLDRVIAHYTEVPIMRGTRAKGRVAKRRTTRKRT